MVKILQQCQSANQKALNSLGSRQLAFEAMPVLKS